MTNRVALDTAVLAAILDSNDKWHKQAIQIRDVCKKAEVELVYFDSVINEVITVLARRMSEQKRIEQFEEAIERLTIQVPGWFILGGQLGLHFCKEKRCLYFLL
ncbi:hypothetical protein KFU94_26750 [Chloroflexi bacterium TSY]|nr:hypothetical protein [Chloroflexi bacterium TSY]